MPRPLEYCIECGNPTGRAGILEDSLYTDAMGPYCEGCFPERRDDYAPLVDPDAVIMGGSLPPSLE